MARPIRQSLLPRRPKCPGYLLAFAGIELLYMLVHSSAADFSRITLKVGDYLLTRAYLTNNGSIAPVGALVFEE